MEQFLIFVLLSGGTYACSPVAETKCDFTEINHLPCSVILEGSVYIQVMTNASGHRVRCKKETPSGHNTVFSLKNGNVTIEKELKNRAQFFISNGTLKIINVERNDSGQYTVEIYGPTGVRIKFYTFNMNVKENVKEQSFPVMIVVCAALGVALLAVLCCFVCREVNRCKNSGSRI
ncbi:uncharacterized protein KZ484_008314 [Pholidichthys leucotaenia]